MIPNHLKPIKEIIVQYGNQINTFHVPMNKNLITFYVNICTSLKLNPNNYYIKYNNRKIDLNYDGGIKLYIYFECDDKPFLELIKENKKLSQNKKIKVNEILQQEYSYKNINNKITKTEGELLSILVNGIHDIEEAKAILKDFYNSLNKNTKVMQKGIITIKNNSFINFEFPDTGITDEFYTYLTYLKYRNPIYKNITIKRSNSKSIQKNKNKKNSIIRIKKFKSIKNIINNNRDLKTINIYPIKNLNKIILEKVNNVNDKNKNEKTEINKYENYFKNQKYIRNASPYITPERLRLIEEQENKKKFINKKGFQVATKNECLNKLEIPNYVSLTPFENPSQYKFRKIFKNKWITKNGFSL